MCSSQYTVPVLAYLCASPATRQPRAPSWLQGPRLKARRLPPVAVAGDRGHSHSKVFISTPEDTGPAHTQMKLQHRSRAPGPPYNSRTRSATGPGREALSPARRALIHNTPTAAAHPNTQKVSLFTGKFFIGKVCISTPDRRTRCKFNTAREGP